MDLFSIYISDQHEVSSFLDISSEFLQNNNIQVLVLDIDGVLCHHDGLLPSDQIKNHLFELSKSGFKLAFHSNNHHETRKREFKKLFPYIEYLDCPPKKPNPAHIYYLAQKYKISLEQVAMVDDRLWTGGMAAYKAKATFIWIKTPIINYSYSPLKEVWFAFVRFVERFWSVKKRTREESNL